MPTGPVPHSGVLVLCARADVSAATGDPVTAGAIAGCVDLDVRYVGSRPGKDIDPLLRALPERVRVVVIGDDADLSAVVLRLLRLELLRGVEVGYATGRPTPVTSLYSLPTGIPAIDLARNADAGPVSLVRNDAGGVLIGAASISPVSGRVYVDETPVLRGPADRLLVTPHPARGLEVTVVTRRPLGLGRRSQCYQGRAVQIGTTPATIVSDGVTYPREMDRWTFYKHTEPLLLAGAADRPSN